MLAASTLAAPTASSRRARSTVSSRQAGDCQNQVITVRLSKPLLAVCVCSRIFEQFDDAQFDSLNGEELIPVPDGFSGFNWPDFS